MAGNMYSFQYFRKIKAVWFWTTISKLCEMSRLILLIKIQDCEMGVTRLVFELLAGHTVANVTYCYMIGQFYYTTIKASTDKEWLL